MSKRVLITALTLLVTLLSTACAPSNEAIQEAVQAALAATQEALPASTPTPTETPAPVSTATSTAAPTEQPGIAGSPECSQYTEDALALIQEWVDTFEVAESTARINLSDRIVELQEIKRRASVLEEPICAAELGIQNKINRLMDAGIEELTDFMAERPSGVARAERQIFATILADAMESLLDPSVPLPRRIHYYVFGETGFQVKYIDDNGYTLLYPEVVGFDAMPMLLTFVIPEGETAAVTLFNPTDNERPLTCAIRVNGDQVVTQTGTGEVTCELAPE